MAVRKLEEVEGRGRRECELQLQTWSTQSASLGTRPFPCLPLFVRSGRFAHSGNPRFLTAPAIVSAVLPQYIMISFIRCVFAFCSR